MDRFKLKSATMAVHYQDGAKGTAVIVPGGSEVVSLEPIEGHNGFDRSKFIAVEWNGTTVCMFLLDLIERGERVHGARG
jgi:hypothetical protein